MKRQEIRPGNVLVSYAWNGAAMWPSELAAKQIMKRLQEHSFPYACQHLSYDYGGHLFVPMEPGLARFFKGDRWKNREPGKRARMDSLIKTLEYVSQW